MSGWVPFSQFDQKCASPQCTPPGNSGGWTPADANETRIGHSQPTVSRVTTQSAHSQYSQYTVSTVSTVSTKLAHSQHTVSTVTTQSAQSYTVSTKLAQSAVSTKLAVSTQSAQS